MSIKEGYLKKWSDSKQQWIDVYCKLLPSGWLQWFADSSSTSPKRSVHVLIAPLYLAFGEDLGRVPIRPHGLTASHYCSAFAVPHEARQTTPLTFFLCQSPAEMNDWRNAITSVVVRGSQQPPPSTPWSQSTQPPPPYYPTAPPSDIGFGGPSYAPPPPPPMPMPMPVPMPTQPPYFPSTYPTQPPIPPGYSGASPSGYNQAPPPPLPPPPGQYSQPVAGQQFTTRGGQPYQIVYVEGKPKKKKMWKNLGVGLASGLAGGYLGSKLFGGHHMFGIPHIGGGWGGGWGGGLGRWGSWSSLSSLSWSD